MSVRLATADDASELERLWNAFTTEVPAVGFDDSGAGEAAAAIGEAAAAGLAWIVDREGPSVGFALARRRGERGATLTGLYVEPAARREGLGGALVRTAVAALAVQGVELIDVQVAGGNETARDVARRWGFREESLTLAASLDAITARLGSASAAPSFGSIHVQTDDVGVVVKAVETYVPRLPGRSAGSIVTQPRGGYVTVYDDVCDRDPAMLRRLAKEISTRTGLVVVSIGLERDAVVRMILFDRGGIVDEYSSVPEFYGPLPPGEVVALQANPVVVERYTGATQAAVRAAAPTAAAPSELPPPREVLEGLAAALGLAGAGQGWADAPQSEGATRVAR